jgi:hypothetical protein
MPVTFQISGDSFDASAWRSCLRDLVRGAEGWEALPITRTVFSKNENRSVDLNNAPVELPEIHCIMNAGIRGVRISQGSQCGGPVKIKLLQLASRGDWAFAYRLLWAGLDAHGLISDDKGNQIDRALLGAEEMEKRFAVAWADDLQGMNRALQTQNPVPLPLAGYSLLVSADELRMEAGALESWLTERADRLGRAYMPPMSTEQSNGQNFSFVNFSDIPSLIAKSTAFLKFDAVQGKPLVPMAQFLAAVAGKIVDAGDYYYLPALNFATDAALVQQLKSAAVNSPGSAGGQPGQRRQLSNHEVGLLIRAPLVVFFLVAAADGKVDKKEIQKFISILKSSVEKGEGGSLFANIVSGTVANFAELMQEIPHLHPGEQLDCLRELLEQLLPPHDCYAFKKALMGLGVAIAEASGGFLGFGSKISAEEKATLDGIKLLLRLQE